MFNGRVVTIGFALVITFFTYTQQGQTSQSPFKKKQLKYKTAFGKCPSRTAGTLAFKIMKTFEEGKSLKDVKHRIVKEKLTEKHFVSSYSVQYDPIREQVKMNFDCPEPLMKVQIYKSNGLDSYEAILVDNGQLYDPTYEVLLINEKKLQRKLPYLAIPVGDMDHKTSKKIADILLNMSNSMRNKLSEVILSNNGDLTIILSVKGSPSSVFIGSDNWENKIKKLKKIVGYMEKKNRVPVIINLVNEKKVVVKFNDKF